MQSRKLRLSGVGVRTYIALSPRRDSSVDKLSKVSCSFIVRPTNSFRSNTFEKVATLGDVLYSMRALFLTRLAQ